MSGLGRKYAQRRRQGGKLQRKPKSNRELRRRTRGMRFSLAASMIPTAKSNRTMAACVDLIIRVQENGTLLQSATVTLSELATAADTGPIQAPGDAGEAPSASRMRAPPAPRRSAVGPPGCACRPPRPAAATLASAILSAQVPTVPICRRAVYPPGLCVFVLAMAGCRTPSIRLPLSFQSTGRSESRRGQRRTRHRDLLRDPLRPLGDALCDGLSLPRHLLACAWENPARDPALHRGRTPLARAPRGTDGIVTQRTSTS